MEKPFNIFIEDVRNPVRCHGNKTVRLVLWSTFSKIFLQKKIKLIFYYFLFIYLFTTAYIH